ncbi:MAG: hypothetical protein INR73_15330 [Williamsia sp.]|nr:hypothetical protein [Williamsia sp.]
MQHVPEISASKIIVPGERIGKTLLGTAAAELERLLGRPDMSDAAMGKAWLTWKGKGSKNGHATELNIYTTYKDSTMREKTVRQIRTTSSFFSTDKGAQVDSSLSFIRQSFPGLKKVGSYKGGSKTYLVYDDRDQGIAFETVANNQEICTGIIVHQKETDVLDVYLTLHPDMQRY